MRAKKQSNGKWKIHVYCGIGEDGKKHQKVFTADTKKEVELMAANFIATNKDERNNKFTLKEAFENYISSKSNVLSPATVRGYKSIIRNNFKELMGRKLSEITTQEIQIAVNIISATASPKTVRNKFGLLSAVINTYRTDINLDHIKLPQKINSDLQIPTVEEIQFFLANCVDEELKRAVYLAINTGIRRSELCALYSGDFYNNGVMINKALVPNDNGEWVLKTTKTTSSTRFVPLNPEVFKKLKPKEGKFFSASPEALTLRFTKECKRLFGKSFRFHDLRHFFVSYILNTDPTVPKIHLQKLGGWSTSYTMDRVYTQILDSEKRKSENKITSAFYSNFSI